MNLRKLSNTLRHCVSLLVVGLSLIFVVSPAAVFAAQAGGGAEHNERGLSVMQGFNQPREQQSIDHVFAIPDREKQIIMFAMGTALLLAVLTTATLGLAMGLHGKDVFVPHIIGAGVSVFLAIAHAVVAVVWFFPF